MQVITGARVQKLIKESGRVVGVTYQDTKTGSVYELRANAVVLSSGGFAADRNAGGLLEKYLWIEYSQLYIFDFTLIWWKVTSTSSNH